MDRSALLQLAEGGLAAFPPSSLADLAAWCWDFGEASGDARYCSLSRTLDMIAEPFEEHGALDSAVVAVINAVLHDALGDVLSAESPQDGAILARSLRFEISERVRAVYRLSVSDASRQ